MNHPDNAASRLAGLCEPHEALLAIGKTDETDDGHYYLAIRMWEHPDVEDAHTVSLRYAYLADDRDNGSDGWTDKGVNKRAYEVEAFLRDMAQMYAAAAARIGVDDPEPDMRIVGEE